MKTRRKERNRWLAMLLSFSLIAQSVPMFQTAVSAQEGEEEFVLQVPKAGPEEDPPETPLELPEPPKPPEPPGDNDLLSTLNFNAQQGQIIVRFKPGQSDTFRAMGTASTDSTRIDKIRGVTGTLLVDVPDNSDIEETLELLRQDERVEYAEPNAELRAQWIGDDLEPNDPGYNQQWGAKQDQMNSVYAWASALETLFVRAGASGQNPYDLNQNGLLEPTDDLAGLYRQAQEVIVAVVDTGVDANHEDLQAKLLPGYNAITKTEDATQPGSSSEASGRGHGTHVAGIIAAATNNELGMAGATGEFPIKILPVKALDSAGVGTLYDVAQGIRWAVDNGAKIVNLSLGARLPDYPQTLAEAVQYAQDQGAIVVAAAGNDAKTVEGFYPAALPGVMSVAATDRDHRKASFSNNYAIINAPGVDIWSTLPSQQYGEKTGTSQAAAFTSAAAALYLSIFPDRETEKVTEALKQGQRRHQKNCRYEGWIFVCDNYYVLDMEQVLSKDALPSSWFTIIEPNYDANTRLSGPSKVTVKVESAVQTNRLVFSLAKERWDENAIPLHEVDVAKGGVIPASGIYSFDWDTTAFPNGNYYLRVTYHYNYYGNPTYYDDGEWIVIHNDTENGMTIQVDKPDGSPAPRAWVTVHHPVVNYNSWEQKSYIYYEEIWSGQADMQGKVILSMTDAVAGNDYLVTARGSGPDFFYYQMVRPPGVIHLNGDNAQKVTISGKRTDQAALAGSVILFELLEGNLPMATDPQHVVELDSDIYDIPLTTLNAEGHGEVYLTSGKYNLRLLNAQELYYLVKRNHEIGPQTDSVAFHPQAGEVAKVRLASEEGYSRSSFLLRDETDWFLGFTRLNSGQVATVTPGRYSAQLDTVYPDPSQSREYVWKLETPPLELTAGQEHPIHFGAPLRATLENHRLGYDEKGYWEKGNLAFFHGHIPDLFGNRTLGLAVQPLSTPPGGSLTMSRTEAPEAELPPETQTYRYDAANGRFELDAQAVTQINPYLEILNAEGNPAPGSRSVYLGYGFADWPNAWWSVPSNLPDGTYQAVLKLEAGSLAESPIVESPPVIFQVGTRTEPPPVEPDLTLTILDREGEPMPYAKVTLVKRNGTVFYEGVDQSQADGTGVARFGSLNLDPQGTYGFLVVGQSREETLMWFTSLTSTQIPPALTVSAAGKPWHRITIEAKDETDSPLTGRGTFAVYGTDAQGVPYGELFDVESMSEEFALWLPEGNYTVQAYQNQRSDWWNPAEARKPLYYLTQKLQVSSTTKVSLGGTSLTELKVTARGTTDVEPVQYVPSLTLFAEGIPYSPIFFIQKVGQEYQDAINDWIEVLFKKKLYVTPGTYRAQGALVHRHYDGNWDYWLDGELNLTAGASVEWQLDNQFQSTITADQASYGIADRIQLNHDIRDREQNRLVAAAIGMYLEGSGGYSAQDHREIAPFVTLTNAQGTEIAHWKNAGSNYYLLQSKWGGYWDGPSIQRLMPRLEAGSTFFGAEYLVSEQMEGGVYKAKLDLGQGPHTFVPSETTVTIVAAPGVPVFTPLPSPTREDVLTITGSALPGAQVTLYSSLNGAPETQVGTTTADAGNGRFQLELAFTEEGSYAFTATAQSDGTTSKRSAPMLVVIDRTPPRTPVGLEGNAPDASHVRLIWTAPAGESVFRYDLKRNGVLIGSVAGQTLTYLDSGLTQETEYDYEVIALDQAGNASSAATVTVRTGSGSDVEPPTPPTNLQATVEKTKVRLTWGAASDNVGVASYRIYRSDAGEAAIATVLATEELAFTDEGLRLDTTYTYTVTAVDFAGNESAKEARIEVRTQERTITSILWQGGRGTHGFLIPGTKLSLTVVGEKNDQAAAHVAYHVLSDPDTVQQAIVELAETKDGQGNGLGIYRGSLTLPEDVTQLASIKGVMGDSPESGVTLEAQGLPASFSGSMEITVNPPDHDVLHGAQLSAWSSSTRSGGTVRIIGAGTYTFPSLAPAEDYEIRLTTTWGQEMAKRSPFTVQSGIKTVESLQPVLPVPLTIRFVNDAGEPMEGIGVLASTPQGQTLGQGVSRQNGWVQNYRDQLNAPFLSTYPAGTELVLTTSVPTYLREQYQSVDRMETVLQPDQNERIITLTKRPTSVLQGKVTRNGEESLREATVTAYQTLPDGLQIMRTTRTDANGQYRLELRTGKVKLVVSERQSGSKEFNLDELTPGENRVFDFDLPIQKAIALTVWTQRIGSPEYAVDIDWRTGVHLHLRGRNLGQEGKPKNLPFTLWSDTNRISISNAEPGDVIEVTADGYEAKMTRDTARVTLDENAWGKVEIRLKEKGRASAVVRDSQGRSHSGTTRAVEVFKNGPSGLTHVSTVSSVNSDLWTGNLDEGTYTLVYHWGDVPHSAYKDGQRLSPRTNVQDLLAYLGSSQVVIKEGVEVKDGEQTDLGPVLLPSPQPVTSGYFRGQEGNDFTASRYESSPGGLITLRASYKYSGGAGSPENLRFLFGLPERAQLVGDSVVLKVKQGPEEVQPTVKPDGIELDFGSAAMSGIEGTVWYTVRMGNQANWPTSTAQAWAQFTVNGSQRQEDLGSAVISLPYVSLTAPSEAFEREVPVNGRAPADAAVRIYDGSHFLAETTATPQGTWKTTIVLPDRGSRAYHWLRAEVAAPEGSEEPIHSEAVRVVYDPDQPRITDITMRQQDGREISFAPVGRFPYVFVPGMSFNFNLNFNDSSRISNVQIHADNQAKVGGGSLPPSSGGIAVSGPLNGRQTVPGKIYASYEVLPKLWSRPSFPPDQEEVRKGMTDPWRDSVVNQIPYDDGNEATREAKAEVLIGGDSRMKVTSTVVVEDRPNYVPSAADAARVASGGTPVYDFDMSVREVNGVLHYSIRAVVPDEEIIAPGGIGAQSIATPAKLVWIFGETAIHGGLSIADLYGTLKNAFDFNAYGDKLDALKDLMNGDCIDPYQQIDFEYEINMAKLAAKRDLVASLTIQTVFTTVGAIGGFGVGGAIGLAAASVVVSSMIGNDQEKKYQDIKKRIEDSSDCEDKDDDPKKKRKKPIADPAWILDPSGYVYEVFPENRIEGVTATALHKVGDQWQVWDAEWYEQENPLITDAEGRYAWDVPEGLWQVLFEKIGYQTARSAELPVPPPQLEVNVPMISTAAPQVTEVRAWENQVDLTFDKYMRVATLSTSTVKVKVDGEVDEFEQPIEVTGTLQPVSPRNDPNLEDVQLARSFRFIPDEPLVVGQAYTVWVDQLVQSYAERLMAEDYTVSVEAMATPVDEVKVTNVQVVPQHGKLNVTWSEPVSPSVSKIQVAWKETGVAEYGEPVELNAGIGAYQIGNLVNGKAYEIRISIVSPTGQVFEGVVVTGTPVADQGPPPGGGDDGGSGGGSTPPPANPNEVKVQVGAGAQTVPAFGGELVLEVPAGAFGGRPVSVTLKKMAGPVSVGKGLSMQSPVYVIDTGGVQPVKPIELKLKYVLANGSMDWRKLGIYREEGGGWVYEGGVVNSVRGTVMTELKEPGRYAVLLYDHTFPDLTGHWSKLDVDVLISRYVVHGVNALQFQPERSITRAELTKLLVELLKVAPADQKQPAFGDVSPDQWYYSFVQTAAAVGLVKGSDGKFRPNDPVTREEMAVLLIKVWELKQKGLVAGSSLTFKDAEQISTWAVNAVRLAIQLGLMKGMNNELFSPRSSATRAQAAVVVLRTMEQLGMVGE